MNELDVAFTEYVNTFKEADIQTKRKEIINSINEITASFDALANQINMPMHYLKSKEITELKDGFESEDDYLEALLVYVENAKSVIGQYLYNIISKE